MDSKKEQEIDWKDQCIKALADYDNLKKHTEKTVNTAITRTRTEMFSQLLPIYWDFHRATVNGWTNEEGLKLLINNFETFFTGKYNLTIIGDDIIGKPFNGDTMSAVSAVSSENENDHNTVQSIVLPGLVDSENNVISHALVIVYK